MSVEFSLIDMSSSPQENGIPGISEAVWYVIRFPPQSSQELKEIFHSGTIHLIQRALENIARAIFIMDCSSRVLYVWSLWYPLNNVLHASKGQLSHNLLPEEGGNAVAFRLVGKGRFSK